MDNLFWIFPPLLCLAVMILMAAMCLRGSGCLSIGRRCAAPSGSDPDTPRQILDRRLASGQIDRDEYEQIHRDLEASGGAR